MRHPTGLTSINSIFIEKSVLKFVNIGLLLYLCYCIYWKTYMIVIFEQEYLR